MDPFYAMHKGIQSLGQGWSDWYNREDAKISAEMKVNGQATVTGGRKVVQNITKPGQALHEDNAHSQREDRVTRSGLRPRLNLNVGK